MKIALHYRHLSPNLQLNYRTVNFNQLTTINTKLKNINVDFRLTIVACWNFEMLKNLLL